MQRRHFHLASAACVSTAAFPSLANASATASKPLASSHEAIRALVAPAFARLGVPGLSLGVTHRGTRHHFNFGVADVSSQQPISERTLFEVGSISKVFTATLGAYAQAKGALQLTDQASQHLPSLRGSAFDAITLIDLATYTAGGLPLQFPSGVTEANVLAYFRRWQPSHAPGSTRVYSNPSIGLFGRIAAQALNTPFADAMQIGLLDPLGLSNTFVRVPPHRMADYAWGYDDGKPIRVTRGVMDFESYGIKTCAADLLRFLELSMDASSLPTELRTAMKATQRGHFQVGDTTQALVWESYGFPTQVRSLRVGNSDELSHKPRRAEPLPSDTQPGAPMLFNKTGGTNGFCAYVLMVPSQHIGIALLCNAPFSRADRVQIAHEVMNALAQSQA